MGVGGQPLGRDTWAGIYNYYKVLESKITVEITELTHDTTGGTTSLVYPSLHGGMMDISATPPTAINVWLNAALAGRSNEQQIFTPIISSNVIGSRDRGEVKYSMTWKPSMFDTAVIDSSTKDTWTPVGQDPDDLNYFTQIAYNPQGAGSRSYVYRTQIEYLVAFKQVNRNLLNTPN